MLDFGFSNSDIPEALFTEQITACVSEYWQWHANIVIRLSLQAMYCNSHKYHWHQKYPLYKLTDFELARGSK